MALKIVPSAIASVLLCAYSPFAAAQTAPPAGQGSPPDNSVDDLEAAVLGGNPAPAPSAPARPPATAGRPQPGSASRSHRAVPDSQDAEVAAAAAGPVDPGFVIELSTSGFASGALLQGGIFVGGRLSNGLIVGGYIDFLSSSTETTQGMASTTLSSSTFQLGAGVRHTFIRAAEDRVDLYAAGQAGVVHTSDKTGSGASPTTSSATGFTVAAGPGLRVWINDTIGVGYAALFRFTHTGGTAQAAGATMSTDSSTDKVGFEGAFQILGVF